MGRHINPAMIVALAALIFAVTGGAYAASGGGNGSHTTASVAKKKKSSSKGTRGPAGPKGATGATGPAGPPGPAGNAGPAGPTGAKGDTGSAGSNGGDGESVVSASLNSGEGGCAQGGSKFTVGGKETTACNGKNGAPGAPGSPGAEGKSVKAETYSGAECADGGTSLEVEGTGVKHYACNGKEGKQGVIHPNETLPSGASETGTWSVSQYNIAAPSATPIEAPISFTLPLAKGSGEEEGPNESESVYRFTETQTTNEEFGTSGCTFEKNNAESKPGAPAGVLCVFTLHESNSEVKFQNVVASNGGVIPPAYGTAGAFLQWTVEGTATNGSVQDRGVWAVTAP